MSEVAEQISLPGFRFEFEEGLPTRKTDDVGAHIESAERLGPLVDDPRGIGLIAGIPAERDPAASQRLDFLRDGLRALALAVEQRHIATRPCQQQRTTAANSLAATRYECALAL